MIPQSIRRPAVGPSADLTRILSLPRRTPVDLASARGFALAEIMTERLRRPDRPPGAPCGCLALGRHYCVNTLLPSQALALYEAPIAGGLLGQIKVGGGKSLLNVLMPMVLKDCRKIVLLLPPKVVGQLVTEYLAIREHFIVPSLIMPSGMKGGWKYTDDRPVIHVLPYSRLQLPDSSILLKSIAPDTILADEIHQIKNPKSARAGRVMRYFVDNPNTRLCGWSGTITSKSILDFAHFLAFSLGMNSPLPIDLDEAVTWSAAIDPSDWPADPGSLMKLARPGENAISAVNRRIADTLGVVSSGPGRDSSDATIILRERVPPKMPVTLKDLIKQVRLDWVRPDGEELIDALAVSAVVQQLQCGFYYRWRFPGGPPVDLILAWFAARKAFGSEMRERLKRATDHLDSPKLLANAAERFHTGYKGPLPVWNSIHWPRWRDIRNQIKHVTEAVWVDDYLARDAVAWGREHRGIIWYEHTAFGQKMAELSGFPLHIGGPHAEERIKAETGKTSIIASIGSHGEGRDGLQFLFEEQHVTNPPASGKEWEQLLGRLSRRGQKADEILTYVYRHTPEMRQDLDTAIRLAKYVEGIFSANQMILAANVEWAI